MNNNINNMNFNNNMNLGNNSNEESQVVTPKNNHIKLGMYKNEKDMSNIVFKRTMYVIVAILVIIIIILIINIGICMTMRHLLVIYISLFDVRKISFFIFEKFRYNFNTF